MNEQIIKEERIIKEYRTITIIKDDKEDMLILSFVMDDITFETRKIYIPEINTNVHTKKHIDSFKEQYLS